MTNKEGKKGRKRVTGFVSPFTKAIIEKAVEDELYAHESDLVSEAVIIRTNEIYERYYKGKDHEFLDLEKSLKKAEEQE